MAGLVFDVAGVIDLGRKSIRIREPFLTVAGETAPSPGITFIRGGIQVESHDMVLRHLRVRAGRDGAPDRSGWEVDGITCWKARDVIVDHCSIAWATDENLSASGPRFDGGDTVQAWREGTSYRITFSNNIVSDGAVARQPRQGRALQRHADPRQRHAGADRRQPLCPQP